MLFISLEGGEGAGKTTQAARLADRIESMGLRCLRVREPGSTALGTDLRKLIKRSHTTDQAMSRALPSLFLFAAARSELVTKVIGPQKVDPDLVVVADRYADSTVAYQGLWPGDRYRDRQDHQRAGNPRCHAGSDVPARLPAGDRNLACARTPTPDAPGCHEDLADAIDRNAEGMKFEEEPAEFHERIRLGFRALVDQEPDRWRVVDATRSIDAISDDIWNAVQDRLPVSAKA